MTETEKCTLAGSPTWSSRFVWYTLLTSDATAAAFYGPVFGWTTRDAGIPNRDYTVASVGEIPVGGFVERPAESFASGEGARWLGYVGVQDVRSTAERVQAAGGVIRRAAEELPEVGTFAVVADPQGADFELFQPPDGMRRPVQPNSEALGIPAWSELVASDWEAVFPFYAEIFGWTKADAIPMCEMGVYQMFAAGSGPIGGMMNRVCPDEEVHWRFYFWVEAIEAAIERVKQNGGTLLYGPAEISGGQQIAQCRDKQGAEFGMVGPGRK